MRVGIFDSGLGGLIVAQAVAKRLPTYDIVYLGDTARVPYGDRSQEVIFRFTVASIDRLFKEWNCGLIVVACNTASAEALRRVQQEYLPTHFPDRRVLGVVIPTAESVDPDSPVGLLATRSTVRSKAFDRELVRLGKPGVHAAQSAPLLVPLIENGGLDHASPYIERYVAPLREAGVKQVILGCTHYGLARSAIQSHIPEATLIAQEDIVPDKLADYLERHPEIDATLSKHGDRVYLVTDLLDHYTDLAETLVGFRPDFQEEYWLV